MVFEAHCSEDKMISQSCKSRIVTLTQTYIYLRKKSEKKAKI